MLNDCPVCHSGLKEMIERPEGKDATFFSCPLCGEFVLSRSLVASLPHILETNKDASSKISHALRTMQQINKGAELNTYTVDEILKRPLPTPREQADLFIRWLAENVEGPGETVWIGNKAGSGLEKGNLRGSGDKAKMPTTLDRPKTRGSARAPFAESNL